MTEYQENLDSRVSYPATHLFIRADERIHAVEAELVTHGKDIQDAKNALEAVEERVNMGVARTGNENRTDIQDLKTRTALMEKSIADTQTRLFDKDTGLIKQFEDARDWQNNFSKNVTTLFIVQLAGALILWAAKHFH